MSIFILGLTGSIGMGKSTTAGFFVEVGVPVWSADDAVHRLYSPGGLAVEPISAMFPTAITEDGGISREELKEILALDPAALARIETVVHPMVADDRRAFVAGSQSDIVVLDIPLLFEIGAENDVNATLLVTAPAAVQRARVFAREGMTEDLFQSILARQMPDVEKRGRATHIIETLGLKAANEGVLALIAYIRERPADA
jgi:dephospho-CoA kinase